jgi:hypothetical protein
MALLDMLDATTWIVPRLLMQTLIMDLERLLWTLKGQWKEPFLAADYPL